MSVLLTDQRAATGSHDDSPSRPLVAETHRLLTILNYYLPQRRWWEVTF